MKIKKIIAGVCAAAISVSALAATVGAGTDIRSITIDSITANMSLTVTSKQVNASASLGANPLDYEILQAQVLIDYTMTSNTDGHLVTGHIGGGWGTGGSGCGAFAQSNHSIVFAKSFNSFNINGSIYGGGSKYELSATA